MYMYVCAKIACVCMCVCVCVPKQVAQVKLWKAHVRSGGEWVGIN